MSGRRRDRARTDHGAGPDAQRQRGGAGDRQRGGAGPVGARALSGKHQRPSRPAGHGGRCPAADSRRAARAGRGPDDFRQRRAPQRHGGEFDRCHRSGYRAIRIDGAHRQRGNHQRATRRPSWPSMAGSRLAWSRWKRGAAGKNGNGS